MPLPSNYPASLKPVLHLSLIILSVISFLYLQSIFIPFLLSCFFALLLHPAQAYLEKKWKMRKELCAMLLVFLLCVSVIVFLTFVTTQFNRIGNNANEIMKNIRVYLNDVKNWVTKEWNIPEKKWNTLLAYIKTELSQQLKSLIREGIKGVSGMLINLLLIPIYVFLMLIYRHPLKIHLIEFSKQNEFNATTKIIQKISGVGSVYLRGLLIEMLLVFILTATGLYITGVPYPIFLALSAALFNLIPYVGNLMAGSLAILTALAFTHDLYTVLAAFSVSALVQLIDNNYIVPKIVASGIKINPLVAIMGIIAGGVIAGLTGMFMAMPFLAITKIFCDESKNWRPVGRLIGELKT